MSHPLSKGPTNSRPPGPPLGPPPPTGVYPSGQPIDLPARRYHPVEIRWPHSDQWPVALPPEANGWQGQPGPSRSVTKVRKPTSHRLHLVLTICTGGAWGLLVWLPLTLWHRYGPRRRQVTRYR